VNPTLLTPKYSIHSFETRPGLAGQPGPGLRKNRKVKTRGDSVKNLVATH